MDSQDQAKALALLGAVLSPGSTIGSLVLQKMMPERDEFENSLFSRLVTDSQGKPQRNKMGEMEILPQETMEGAFWKKNSPMLPRFLKPETKLSPVTQQRIAEEMVRAVSMTKDPTQQAAKGKVALELINKLPGMSGKPVSGAEIQEIAKGSGSTLKSKGEVTGLRLLHNALTNKSIYHGVKTPEGRNTLWQEMYKPKAEAQEVRNAMVDRRVQKGVATPEEKAEFDLRQNSNADLSTTLMDSLRALGKWPPKIGGGSGREDTPKFPKLDIQEILRKQEERQKSSWGDILNKVDQTVAKSARPDPPRPKMPTAEENIEVVLDRVKRKQIADEKARMLTKMEADKATANIPIELPRGEMEVIKSPDTTMREYRTRQGELAKLNQEKPYHEQLFDYYSDPRLAELSQEYHRNYGPRPALGSNNFTEDVMRQLFQISEMKFKEGKPPQIIDILKMLE